MPYPSTNNLVTNRISENPTLTIVSLVLRQADYIARQMVRAIL